MKQRIAVQFFSIITQSAEGRTVKKKKGLKKITTLQLDSFLLFFFPCHAFNGSLFPIGSALEVAPASISLISLTCIRLAVG